MIADADSSAAQSPPTVVSAVAENTAIRAIEALKYRYWRACDAKDTETFRACFVSEGGELNYGPLGTRTPDEMKKLFAKIALATDEQGPLILDMHHGYHPVIIVDSTTTAHGQWTMRFRSVDRHMGTETVMSGEYEDTYVCEDGTWRMRTCIFTPGWSISRPLGDAKISFPAK